MDPSCLTSLRLDVRALTGIITICIVILFYVLLSQYDADIFDAPSVIDAIEFFEGQIGVPHFDGPDSESPNDPKSLSIPFDITKRVGSAYVVVGFCCHTHDGVNKECEPQQFVIDIAEGTFSSTTKQIVYQQCTKKGTAPSFLSNWIPPDILLVLCMRNTFIYPYFL